MNVDVPSGLIRQALRLKNLPYSFEATDLPDAATLRRVRAAKNKVMNAVTDLLLGLTIEELVENRTVYVKLDSRGRVVRTEFENYNQVKWEIDTYYLEWDTETALQRINRHLPDWAEAAVTTVETPWTRTMIRIRAKDGVTGSVRDRAIEELVKLNAEKYEEARRNYFAGGHPTTMYREIEVGSDGRGNYGTLSTKGMTGLEEFGATLKRDYLMLMRRAFTQRVKDETPEPVKKDTLPNFEAFMRRRAVLDTNEQHLGKMPILPHGTTVNLTWGIEVEAAGARGVEAPKGWDRKGDGSLRSAYNEGGTRYIDPEECEEYDHNAQIENPYYDPDVEQFIPNPDYDPEAAAAAAAAGEEYDEPEDIENDDYADAAEEYIENPDYENPRYCSYCGDVEEDEYDDGGDDTWDSTGEFVSPILTSFHSNGLEKLLARLAQEPQNDSAGVHVHVGAKDLTPRQVATVVLGYQMIEPLIEASYRRETREYCKVRPASDVLNVVKSAKNAKRSHPENRYDNPKPGEVMQYGDRYHAVNLWSLSAHGTIEFRAMGPVYEYEHLIKWASFCREMVNSVKNGAQPRHFAAVKSWDDLAALFAKFGVEYAKAQLAELEQQLTPELVEV